MHFSHLNTGSGSKATKIAVVAAVHVVLAMGLIKSMNSKMLQMPKLPEEITLLLNTEPPPPPPPPEPAKPMPQIAPPDVVVPKVEVPAVQTPPPDAIAATTVADPAPAQPAQQTAPAPQAAPANPGTGMQTAVMAEGCAKPEYPARAARNGESGTVTLALLIGPDGRVNGSKVQSSSGSRELDKAAVSALSMCKFKPATSGGQPTQAWGQIAYVWTLEE